ncbi:hypothetical protein [Neoroseomonas lacus]|uniref:Uncharacterized protein n=1 Tax=Neoroseomonas lacus TaxID=287609 RepID=A0A917KL80_9PROT|nr:hypothetical protein [Neoroseomonas lacus]GGJ14043.1 hypothetical protein GCM10011320_21640 [Neoroseomonas lacus]
MTTRLSPVDVAALKTAMRLLVEDVGGIDAAASVSRLAASSIAESYDPHRANRMPAVDVVADLEAVGGTPRVTAILASMAGRRLVPIVPARGRVGRSIAEVLTSSSEVGAAYVTATADGKLSRAERQRIATEVLELLAACEQATAVLLNDAEE